MNMSEETIFWNPEEDDIDNAICRWIIDMRSLTIGNEKGVGTYGIVHQANYGTINVAVKKLFRSKITVEQEQELLTDTAHFVTFNHPNVVTILGACVRDRNLAIVSEYLPEGNIQNILYIQTLKWTWSDAVRYLKEIIEGLEYLHSNGVLHRDLKTSNILLARTYNSSPDQEFTAKLCDYGYEKIKLNNRTLTRCGSPAWTAPEITRGERFTEKSDIYSLGMIAWQLITRLEPFKGMPFMHVTLEVLRNELRPTIPSDVLPEYASLIQDCWAQDPQKRPTLAEVKQRVYALPTVLPLKTESQRSIVIVSTKSKGKRSRKGSRSRKPSVEIVLDDSPV
jgi:serine/threonine protein kinase